MSKKAIAFARGRLAGVRESGWECGDCGNFYDATVDECPNRLLDEALVGVVRQENQHRNRKPALRPVAAHTEPGDCAATSPESGDDGDEPDLGIRGPVVAGQEPSERGDESTPRTHLEECPCAQGSCCPWMGDCACQCLCDFIAQVQERVRQEFDPSQNNADEGYRTGYATAVTEFMSNHGDTGALRLGYGKALLDVDVAIGRLTTQDFGFKSRVRAAVSALSLEES